MTIQAQDIERINFHHKGKEKFRFIHFNMQVVVDPSKSTSL